MTNTGRTFASIYREVGSRHMVRGVAAFLRITYDYTFAQSTSSAEHMVRINSTSITPLDKMFIACVTNRHNFTR